MNSDYIALDELATIASMPTQVIENYVDKAFGLSTKIDYEFSDSEKRLMLLFKLDELGLGNDFKSEFFKLYPPVDGKTFDALVELQMLFAKYKVKDSTAVAVIDEIEKAEQL